MATSASIGALFSRNAAVSAALLLVSFVPRPGGAQSTVSGGFVAGSRQIWAMDLTSLSAEGLPRGVTWTNGAAKVVTKDGVPMIQATDRTDLLIRLPEALPSAFTIQLEITPKSDGAPEDVALEGTPEVNRGDASMQIVWQVISLMAVGGGEMFQMGMPDSIALTLPLRPVPIDVSFDGGTVRLFTDGKLLMNLTNRQFVRGAVLRVTLGGGCREFQTKCATAADEDRYSVYLSKLRIAATSGVVALATSANIATLATGTPTAVAPTGVMPTSDSSTSTVAGVPAQRTGSAMVTTSTVTGTLPVGARTGSVAKTIDCPGASNIAVSSTGNTSARLTWRPMSGACVLAAVVAGARPYQISILRWDAADGSPCVIRRTTGPLSTHGVGRIRCTIRVSHGPRIGWPATSGCKRAVEA